MKFPLQLPILLGFALASAQAAEEATPATPKPGLVNRLLHPFGGGGAATDTKINDANFKSLEMKLGIEPSVPKLSTAREVKVTVTLSNKGKKMVQLDFPTSQRLEVLIKNKAGKRVVQWSEDQAFTSDPTLVAINPGERLEYSVNVSTRDFVPGETYTLEAFFPNFEPLRKSLPITPQK